MSDIAYIDIPNEILAKIGVEFTVDDTYVSSLCGKKQVFRSTILKVRQKGARYQYSNNSERVGDHSTREMVNVKIMSLNCTLHHSMTFIISGIAYMFPLCPGRRKQLIELLNLPGESFKFWNSSHNKNSPPIEVETIGEGLKVCILELRHWDNEMDRLYEFFNQIRPEPERIDE